jgi:hypothetical protein
MPTGCWRFFKSKKIMDRKFINGIPVDLNSVTVTIPNGETSSNDEEFARIDGKIIGFTSHTIKGDDDAALKLAVKNGGDNITTPTHPAITETVGRSSFKDGIAQIEVERPGNITAQLKSDIPVKNNVKVEVVIVSINRKYC